MLKLTSVCVFSPRQCLIGCAFKGLQPFLLSCLTARLQEASGVCHVCRGNRATLWLKRVCTYRRLKVVHCLQSVGQFPPPPCIQIKSLTLKMIQYSYDDGISWILNVDGTSIFRVHNCCFHLLFLDCGSSICQLENQDFLAFKQYYVSKSILSFCEYEIAGLSRWNWSADKKETGKASS